MTIDEPTTINAWIHQPGPINLRVRTPEVRRDLLAAEGIVFGAVTGVAIIAWVVVAVQWFGRSW